MKKYKRNDGVPVLFVALLLGLLTACMSYFNLFGFTELMYEDMFYQKGHPLNNHIKIIAIDDESLRELGDYSTWTRQVYADLVNTLCEGDEKPAVIAFDIIYADNKDTAGDVAFAKACEKAQNVIVASKLSSGVNSDFIRGTSDNFYVYDCVMPYDELAKVAGTGFTNIILDDDGFLRHSIACISQDGVNYDSFSYAVYKSYLHEIDKIPSWIFESTDKQEFIYIDYIAKPGSYEVIPLCDVLDGTVPASVFDDNIVLVGSYTEGMMDSYSVPIDRRTLMYGVEVNANIIQTLLDERKVSTVDSFLYAALSGICLMAFFCGIYNRKLRVMVGGLILVNLLHIFVCSYFYENGTIIPILYWVLATVLAFLINLLWKYVRERLKRTQELRELMFSMAEAMTEAIDGRTPYNASHTRKVAEYSVGLAHYINKAHKEGRTKLKLTKNEIKQLNLAALLHDVGKMDVPTSVLDKPSRLGQYMAPLLGKWRELRLVICLDAANGVISRKEEEHLLLQLEEAKAFVEKINLQEWLSDEDKEKITQIRSLSYTAASGEETEYLSELEYECLMIPKGTLTADEMEQVHSHVVYTDKILSKIKFGKDYDKVREIAASHHEFINGEGYPNKKSADELSTSMRILTIADVYDALTADDRPYKKAKTKEQSFKILHFMEKDQQIDGEILKFAEELWGEEKHEENI